MIENKYAQKVLDNKENVQGVIYIITNTCTKKCYVGQTMTHKLNSKKFRPFGAERRLKQHISDAIKNTKKKSVFIP